MFKKKTQKLVSNAARSAQFLDPRVEESSASGDHDAGEVRGQSGILKRVAIGATDKTLPGKGSKENPEEVQRNNACGKIHTEMTAQAARAPRASAATSDHLEMLQPRATIYEIYKMYTRLQF